MKKSMLCAGLMTVLCASTYAGANDNATSTQQTTTPPAAEQMGPNSGIPANPTPESPTPSNLQGQDSQTTIIPAEPASTAPAGQETTTPATQDSTAPTTQGATTPATQDSTAPTTQGATTPATQDSTAPTTQGATTPATQESNAPAAQGTSTPATQDNTAPTTQGATTPTTQDSNAPAAQGATTPVTQDTTPQAVAATQAINCNYHIPAETTQIDSTLVMKWAEKAAEQSFNLDHNNIDKQLADLQVCYTEQGWQGFNDALQKSGNLTAISSQQLTVSSMVSAESKITQLKDNQWKVIIPMQVVYQNDKEKLTQPLTVNLIVGRKISGDLGVMQMIAIPQQTNNKSESNPTEPEGSSNSASPPASTNGATPEANTNNSAPATNTNSTTPEATPNSSSPATNSGAPAETEKKS